jgi:hypothetical protein
MGPLFLTEVMKFKKSPAGPEYGRAILNWLVNAV